MEPAPYAGFMARALDDENEQRELLKKQEVEVAVDGVPQVLRPSAVHVRGVDNLSTQDIEAFVDLYLNWAPADGGYEKEHDVSFRVQWIDDSNANVVFKNHADAVRALHAMAEAEFQANGDGETGGAAADAHAVFSPQYLAAMVEERRAKSYSASIEFHKFRQRMAGDEDLFEAKKAQEATMDEDESSVVLHIRMAVQADRKPKNASAYSRYYLLHGEPDRSRPRRAARGRGSYARDDDTDLFAHKLKDDAGAADDDLFAHKLRARSRSPGR